MSHLRALCLVPALLAAGCIAAATQVYAELNDDDEPVAVVAHDAAAAHADEPEVDPDAIALAEALLPTGAATEAIAPSSEPPLAELELRDVELEWVEHHGVYGYHYGGGVDASKVLRVAAHAKVTAPAGEKAEVVIKASCDDVGYVVTDAETSTIDDSFGTRIPAPGTEFRIAAKLFVAAPPTEPSKCRVTVMLRDPSRTPIRRGAVARCWDAQTKRPTECDAGAGPTAAPAAEAWSVADAQFLPTGELGLSVVAGRARVPDRVAVRATCNVGKKQFVEFKFLTGRWYALDPGEGLRVREQLPGSWEFTRATDCDLQIHDVGFDFDKQTVRGMKVIAALCSRPSGVRTGSCRTTAPEAPAPDPSGVPARIEVLHGGANAYGGWYNAYVMGELTMQGVVSAGATLDFVAHCGSRTEKQQVVLQTGLELVYPGQSLRAQGNVSFSGRAKPAGCTTEMVLSAKDAAGAAVSWSLAKQCYDKHGSITPCAGAPAPTGLGMRGVGVGGVHKRSASGKPI